MKIEFPQKITIDKYPKTFSNKFPPFITALPSLAHQLIRQKSYLNFLLSDQLNQQIIDLIYEYFSIIGLLQYINNNNFEFFNPSKIINQHTAFTAKYIGDQDTGIVMTSCQIDRNITMHLKVIKKQDEIWFGISSDILIMNNTGGYWNQSHCVTYQGGRKSTIDNQQNEDNFAVTKNVTGPSDTYYGNIQEGSDSFFNRVSNTYHMLYPIQDGDQIKMYWEHETQSMKIWHNNRQMLEHVLRNKFGSNDKLFGFVVGDVQGDQQEMWLGE